MAAQDYTKNLMWVKTPIQQKNTGKVQLNRGDLTRLTTRKIYSNHGNRHKNSFQLD